MSTPENPTSPPSASAESAPVVTSAFDRVQTRPDRPPSVRRDTGSRIRPGLIATVAVAVVVGIGAAVWLWPDGDSGGDLLVQLQRTSETYTPDIVTTQPAQAEDYVADTLGWAIPPPDLPALAVVGVGVPTVATIRPSAAATPVPVQMPVFRYEAADGARAHVFVYDYILLDRMMAHLDLPAAMYAVLSEPVPVDSRVVGDTFVVTWRDRAILF